MSCLLYTEYCLILFERSIFGYSEILERTRANAVGMSCTTVGFREQNHWKFSRVEKGHFRQKSTQIIQ